MIKRFIATLALASLLPAPAFAWGYTGHTYISRVAAEHFPAELPAFVRSKAAVDMVATLGPEEDRIKGAGQSWDDDNDPGHFLDVDDNLSVYGVVKLTALPPSMEAYVRALEAAHTDPYKAGFVPYSIMDGWERVRKDFAIWRVDDYLASHALTDAAKARFAADRALRETLTLRDIGVWSHFVADGSQPLHITIHFNGWGPGPDPKGYSTSHHIHSMFESEFVSAHVTMGDVVKHLSPFTPANPHALLSQTDIASIVGGYLSASALAVGPLYDIEKAGGFAAATPAAVDFAATQLGRGATMLRDLVALAWEDSANESVGYPPIAVRDVLSGKVVPPNDGQ
ncbi:MAG TPA: hypothetical protein VFN49_06890 [Candidatus Aquilonibacter sp.]|nr:hypothetical protein [Candidatus Aquilonibacter sp.]